MQLSPNELATWAGEHLPTPVLRRVIGQCLGSLSVALCLHRVAEAERTTDWQPGLNIAPTRLDALIELLVSSRPTSAPWLTVSFDDGYDDAAQYIASRAPRFKTVEFLFFVCPEKLEQRAGFRWDAAEEALKAGAAKSVAAALMAAPVTLATENARPDLRALADAPEYQLASVETVKQLARLPNVKLGNHSNLHLVATQLPVLEVDEDYRRSTETFTRLFGPQRHFAFPFGTPKFQFDQRHVELLRALGDFTIWSTEPRPYRAGERGVQPRYAVNGRQSAKAIAGWVAARALKYRCQSLRT